MSGAIRSCVVAIVWVLGSCASPASRWCSGVELGTDEVVIQVEAVRDVLPGAWPGCLGCIEHVDGQAYVLESLVSPDEECGRRRAAFVGRVSDRLPLPADTEFRWYDRGPIVHVWDASCRGDPATSSAGVGTLARVVCEGPDWRLCVLFEPESVAVGVHCWQCRPELSQLLSDLAFPALPSLVTDSGPCRGVVETRTGAYALVREVAEPADTWVDIDWHVHGDARVEWRGSCRIARRAWLQLESQYGPFTVGAADDVVLGCAVVPARRAGLTPRSHCELTIRSGGEVVTERALFPAASSFAVACQLRSVLADVWRATPEVRQFSCELRVEELDRRGIRKQSRR